MISYRVPFLACCLYKPTLESQQPAHSRAHKYTASCTVMHSLNYHSSYLVLDSHNKQLLFIAGIIRSSGITNCILGAIGSVATNTLAVVVMVNNENPFE